MGWGIHLVRQIFRTLMHKGSESLEIGSLSEQIERCQLIAQ